MASTVYGVHDRINSVGPSCDRPGRVPRRLIVAHDPGGIRGRKKPIKKYLYVYYIKINKIKK